VVADLIDIARGSGAMPFSLPVASLAQAAPADAGERISRAYIRFMVADRPGVLAEITAAMRDAGVSIESLIQQGQPEAGGVSNLGPVLVAMVTHDGPERAVERALDLLAGSSALAEQPLVMRILG
jgi:homoserine dehydrogenase